VLETGLEFRKWRVGCTSRFRSTVARSAGSELSNIPFTHVCPSGGLRIWDKGLHFISSNYSVFYETHSARKLFTH